MTGHTRTGLPGRIGLTTAALAGALLLAVPPAPVAAQTKSGRGEMFAQKLVGRMQAEHPEADEIGIMTTTPHGCVGIASTDRSDVGERCEKDDSEPIRTGKPHVAKEGGGYAVSLPLHDSAGKAIGAVAIEFKPGKERTAAAATEAARKIETEMAAMLPSKAKLFERTTQAH